MRRYSILYSINKDDCLITSIHVKKSYEAKKLIHYLTQLIIKIYYKKNLLQRCINIDFLKLNALFNTKHTLTYFNILRVYSDICSLRKRSPICRIR